VAAVDVVAADGEAEGRGKVDVDGLAADEVACDGPHADAMIPFVTTADEADVATARRVGGLDRVAGDGSFADRALFAVDIDFCGGVIGEWCAVRRNHEAVAIVVLDVVASDLQVADLAPLDTNASKAAVANVRAGDNRLMQVAMV